MAISMEPISQAYYNNASSTASTSGLEKNLEKDYSKATDDELMDVCKEFEAYFTEQVFKAMDKMVPRTEESSSANSQLKDYYKEQLIQQYAEKSADGEGLGIAKMMYEQMKRNYDI